jgi:hypothetical protein
MDKIVDAADAMTTACANCHDKYGKNRLWPHAAISSRL